MMATMMMVMMINMFGLRVVMKSQNNAPVLVWAPWQEFSAGLLDIVTNTHTHRKRISTRWLSKRHNHSLVGLGLHHVALIKYKIQFFFPENLKWIRKVVGGCPFFSLFVFRFRSQTYSHFQHQHGRRAGEMKRKRETFGLSFKNMF